MSDLENDCGLFRTEVPHVYRYIRIIGLAFSFASIPAAIMERAFEAIGLALAGVTIFLLGMLGAWWNE